MGNPFECKEEINNYSLSSPQKGGGNKNLIVKLRGKACRTWRRDVSLEIDKKGKKSDGQNECSGYCEELGHIFIELGVTSE